jgi:hypothetical protein
MAEDLHAGLSATAIKINRPIIKYRSVDEQEQDVGDREIETYFSFERRASSYEQEQFYLLSLLIKPISIFCSSSSSFKISFRISAS